MDPEYDQFPVVSGSNSDSSPSSSDSDSDSDSDTDSFSTNNNQQKHNSQQTTSKKYLGSRKRNSEIRLPDDPIYKVPHIQFGHTQNLKEFHYTIYQQVCKRLDPRMKKLESKITKTKELLDSILKSINKNKPQKSSSIRSKRSRSRSTTNKNKSLEVPKPESATGKEIFIKSEIPIGENDDNLLDNPTIQPQNNTPDNPIPIIELLEPPTKKKRQNSKDQGDNI